MKECSRSLSSPIVALDLVDLPLPCDHEGVTGSNITLCPKADVFLVMLMISGIEPVALPFHKGAATSEPLVFLRPVVQGAILLLFNCLMEFLLRSCSTSLQRTSSELDHATNPDLDYETFYDIMLEVQSEQREGFLETTDWKMVAENHLNVPEG